VVPIALDEKRGQRSISYQIGRQKGNILLDSRGRVVLGKRESRARHFQGSLFRWTWHEAPMVGANFTFAVLIMLPIASLGATLLLLQMLLDY
jgi:hypothetical protein